ncbi:MAG: ABC transporter permease [Acetobacteraceae bacterium]
MLSYLARRLVLALITVWAITLVTFLIMQLPPGDFVDAYVAQASAMGSAISAAEADALRHAYGLDQPIYIQYFKWLSLVATGNFGLSFEYGRPVTEVIGDRLWLTIAISLGGIIVTWLVALPIGIYSAVRQYSLGRLRLHLPGLRRAGHPELPAGANHYVFRPAPVQPERRRPVLGEYALAPWSWAKLGDLLAHLPVPIFILALAGTAQLVRIMRANLLMNCASPMSSPPAPAACRSGG